MSEIRWVKFEAHHGPGHQSHRVEYRPYDYDMSEDDLQHELERWSQQFNNVSSTADFVDRLPDEVLKRMIKEYISKVEWSDRVLIGLRSMRDGL